jgi:hypothetical protein
MLPEDLAHFLTLTLRDHRDVASLDGRGVAELLVFRARGQVVARGHREPIGHEVGHAKNQDDPGRQLGSYDSRDDRKRRDRTVDPSVDPVP